MIYRKCWALRGGVRILHKQLQRTFLNLSLVAVYNSVILLYLPNSTGRLRGREDCVLVSVRRIEVAFCSMSMKYKSWPWRGPLQTTSSVYRNFTAAGCIYFLHVGRLHKKVRKIQPWSESLIHMCWISIGRAGTEPGFWNWLEGSKVCTPASG